MKHLQKVLGLVLTIVLLSLAVPFSVSAATNARPVDSYKPKISFHMETVKNAEPRVIFHLDSALFKKEGNYTWSVWMKMDTIHSKNPSATVDFQYNRKSNSGGPVYYMKHVKEANKWFEVTETFQASKNYFGDVANITLSLFRTECVWDLADFVLKDPDGKVVYSMANDKDLNGLSELKNGDRVGHWECKSFRDGPISVNVISHEEVQQYFFLNSINQDNPTIHYTMRKDRFQNNAPYSVEMFIRLDDVNLYSKEPKVLIPLNIKGLDGADLCYYHDTNGFVKIKGTISNPLTNDLDIIASIWKSDAALSIGGLTIKDKQNKTLYSMASDPALKELAANPRVLNHGDQVGDWSFRNIDSAMTLSVLYKTVPFQKKNDAVYQIGEGEKASYFFNSLAAQKFLESGQAVRLIRDIQDHHANLPNGVKLDLNGHTLETKNGFNVFADSTVYDSAKQKGCLKVAKDMLILPQEHKTLPLWDEAKQGYAFSNVVVQQLPLQPNAAHDSFRFKFRPLLDHAALTKAYLSNGGADNGLKLGVRLTWLDAQNATQQKDFFFADEMLQKAYPMDGAQKAFYLRFIGLDLTQYREASICFVLASDTGVQFTSTPQMCK